MVHGRKSVKELPVVAATPGDWHSALAMASLKGACLEQHIR
jgi:hypothetical protein